MLTIAVSMVRDEADIALYTFGHLLTQVDHVLVADNGSVDGSGDILRDLGVEVIEDSEVGYRQGEKMTALAHRAAEKYGTGWILPVDADELWTTTARLEDGTLLGVDALLAEQAPDVYVVEAPLYDHIATGQDPEDPDPIKRMQWRLPDPAPLPKVACRYAPDLQIAQGNHAAHYSQPRRAVRGGLVIHHYSHRSPEQMVRKVRNGAEAYAATDLPEEMGLHWRQWGQMLEEQGSAAIEDLFWRWWWRADPEAELVVEDEKLPPLVHDPCVSRS